MVRSLAVSTRWRELRETKELAMSHLRQSEPAEPRRSALPAFNRPPLCPACGCTMDMVRVLPAAGFASEQLVFRCGQCELVMTDAGERRIA